MCRVGAGGRTHLRAASGGQRTCGGGPEFLSDNDDIKDEKDHFEVKKELMPDLLHPNANGHRILAKCIRNYVADQMK